MQALGEKYPFRFALFLAAYYVTNSVYQGFITVYFKGIGYSQGMIGALMAAVPLVSIFTQPIWGGVGDRSKSRNRVLRLLAVGAGISMIAFRFSGAFPYIMVMICAYSCFFTALQPMGDSIILEQLSKNRQPFGPIRLIGCLSFAVSSVVFGYVLEGRMVWTIYITAMLLIGVYFATYALPETTGHQRTGEKMSMLALLKQRELIKLLAFMTLLQMTMGYFYTFFSVHYTSLPGGNAKLLGWCYLISATSEVPFLLLSDKLFEKLGAGKLMCISAAVLTARWVSLGFLTNVYWVMATQVFHGWGFIVLTVSMAKYINLAVPDELKSRGQMLLAVVGFGIARVVGNFGGGLLSEAVGFRNGFYLCAVVTVAALVIFGPKFLGKAPANGESCI